MGKISSYSTSTPVLTDKLIGTDVGGSPTDSTKNFLLSDIQALFFSATANINLTGDITASGTISGSAVKATTIAAVVPTDLKITGLPTYADNTAAVLGGLATNGIYKTATGELRIVV
tara:strand:+ start:96 stop:446 length:351 start_codon:yes stop_codon:yes gene_type:complete